MDPTTAQVTDEVSTQPEQQQQTPGLQSRIDELTARLRASEQATQEVMQRMMETQAQLLASQQRPAPAATPDPLQKYAEVLDPRVIEAFQAERARMEADFRAKLAQVEAQQGVLAIQSAAASAKIDPAVAARAQALYQQAKNNGANPSPDEALKYAIGDWYVQQQAKAGQVLGLPTTAFNAPVPVPQSFSVPPQAQRQVPANLESLPLEQQLALLEKLGFGDDPL